MEESGQILSEPLDTYLSSIEKIEALFAGFTFYPTRTPYGHENTGNRPSSRHQCPDRHCRVDSILRDKSETYALFQWLNAKFNGDLFTGKGTTDEERNQEWAKEKKAVSQYYLDILADFVSGEIDLGSGQASLWPEYSFDALPLESISSVYDEFLGEIQKESSAYYTPSHLVDFVLDGVLPWSGTDWKIRVLDPCCGSGIFLVKSFQRLAQRWRNAHPGDDPKADVGG
jgi:hypothetical protein